MHVSLLPSVWGHGSELCLTSTHWINAAIYHLDLSSDFIRGFPSITWRQQDLYVSCVLQYTVAWLNHVKLTPVTYCLVKDHYQHMLLYLLLCIIHSWQQSFMKSYVSTTQCWSLFNTEDVMFSHVVMIVFCSLNLTTCGTQDSVGKTNPCCTYFYSNAYLVKVI